MNYTSYFDTLTVGSINASTKRILRSPSFWTDKYRAEHGFSLPLSEDSFLAITDNIGGSFVAPVGAKLAGLTHIVKSALRRRDVLWAVTPEGLLFSLLLSDPLWTNNTIPAPISFIRPVDAEGYTVLAVTNEHRSRLYLVKAFNRQTKLFWQTPEPVVDAALDNDELTIVYRGGSIFVYRDQKIIRESELVPPTTEDNADLGSGKERLAELALGPPKETEPAELPPPPVSSRVLDTSDIYDQLDRAQGAEYDREEQRDIVDSFQVNDREILSYGGLEDDAS